MESEVWISTEPSTRVKLERAAQARLEGDGDEDALTLTQQEAIEELGAFAKLIPQNRYAREAFQRLISRKNLSDHHKQFVRVDNRLGIPEAKRENYFLLSLGLLPEFPTIGWRLGRGRLGLPNQGVDLLIDGGEEVAGRHARFAWVNGKKQRLASSLDVNKLRDSMLTPKTGGGGFFVFADNLNGKEIILNGEVLQHTQRMVPFRNQLLIGECSFTLQFQERSQDQEDQFQMELAAFYRRVLQGEVPIILPTPSGHEITVGDWIMRSPISSGASGRVSLVTHRTSGKPAAAKELWVTRRNRYAIEGEVSIARKLKDWNHVSSPLRLGRRRAIRF